ncbi:MAG: efflux RND transporter periplasmic adaptor subunit [Deltaproteobacteria bacterium]|nr:efflux RND transporter periplasmic adaptor subunit [Deltaproteobacteria bacterium]
MSAARRTWIGVALLAGAVVITGATLLRGGGAAATPVRVASVATRDVIHRVLAQGKVRARTQVDVASEIGGRVDQVNVKVGDVVKAGDPLFSLDAEQLENAVEQLRVSVSGATALKTRAELAVAEAERGVQRDRSLKDKGVLADEQLKIGESRVALARAELDSASAQLERVRLDLSRARDALRRARVTAPSAGTVVAVGVEVGQVVSAVQGLAGESGLSGFGFSGGASASSAPVILADLSELQLKLDVDELDVALVKEGQPVRITAQGIKDASYQGVVERVGLMGREQGGAVLFVVEVKVLPGAGTEQLRPGMSAQAEIEVQRLTQTLAVPLAAVLEGDGKDKPDRVFTYQGDDAAGTAHEVTVKLGPTDDDVIAVTNGLAAGERVVEGPFRALRGLDDGDAVRVQTDKEADAGPKKDGDQRGFGQDDP